MIKRILSNITKRSLSLRKHLYLAIVVIVICFVSAPNAFSKNSEGVKTSNTFDNTGDLVDEILYVYDPTSLLTINTISSKKFNKLINPNLGFNNNGVYWFKVKLKSLEPETSLVFDVKESTIKSIEIYVDNQLVANDQNDNIGTTNLSLHTLQTEVNCYFLKVEFSRQAHFPLMVHTHKAYDLIEKLSFFKAGMYYGFVFLVLIINLFFYSSLKEETFLWYCVFVIATNLVISNFDGVFPFFFKTTTLAYLDLLFHYLIPLTGAFFATSFLRLSIYVPKSKIYGGILLSISVILYILFIITDFYLLAVIADVFGLLVLLYYWVLGVYVLRTHQFAVFFVIGYSLVLFSAIFYVVPMSFGFDSFVSLNHLKFGALFEMLILTFAISHRVKKMQEENETIREEINQYIKQVYVLEGKLDQNTEGTSDSPLELKITELTKKHALTDRETDVLLCISKGYTHQKTADELFISVNTIKYHTRNIYQKLSIKSKGEVMQKMMGVQLQ